MVDFNLRLPIAPALTEIDGVIQAGGVMAATFTAPASGILDELTKTVDRHVDEACRVLAELWLKRRANPALLRRTRRSGSNLRG